MKVKLISRTIAVVFCFALINCGQKGMNASQNITEGQVVATDDGDMVTLPLEYASLQKAPSNNLPLEVSDLPSELITLLTPPAQTTATSGGFLSGLFGGGKCGLLSNVLSFGASFLSGGNPIVGMLVPQIANSLLNCGSSSSLTNLIPNGASGNEQIFALVSQILQAQNLGKDPFALLNGLKNPQDLSSIIGIVNTLVGQTGNTQLQGVLGTLLNFQNNYGSSIGQCGNMNAMACQVFQIVNQLRSKKGLQALVPSVGCTLAAQEHSKDMFENSILTHVSSKGVSAKARYAQFGLKTAAENIVKGQKLTAQAAVEMWMSSLAHKNNILSESFTSGGVGFINGYFTQCFTK